jgi:uncharacterized protein YqjF (DUF2071 family)
LQAGWSVAFDFPYEILDQRDHRPWPMPDAPWIMTQSWHDLLFAHWPVDIRMLQEKVPPGLPIDLYDGRAWVGVVPFHITNLSPRGVPSIPFVSAFPELNVRTYVTLEDKPGVYFFSLDAGSSLAVAGARTLFQLPYFAANMDVQVEMETVRYRSERQTKMPSACFEATYRPIGPINRPEPGTLEHFLTERYCLYTVDDSFHAKRLQIHHPRWPLQPAAADIRVNTMAEAAGLRLPSTAPLLHFAKRQDMVAWGTEAVGNF